MRVFITRPPADLVVFSEHDAIRIFHDSIMLSYSRFPGTQFHFTNTIEELTASMTLPDGSKHIVSALAFDVHTKPTHL